MELAARREESGARKDQARVGRAARRRDPPAPGRREGVSEGRGRGRGGAGIRSAFAFAFTSAATSR